MGRVGHVVTLDWAGHGCPLSGHGYAWLVYLRRWLAWARHGCVSAGHGMLWAGHVLTLGRPGR
jgi:hypothetical protein